MKQPRHNRSHLRFTADEYERLVAAAKIYGRDDPKPNKGRLIQQKVAATSHGKARRQARASSAQAHWQQC